MQIAIVDCETTGLDQHDQPISIAVVLSNVDDRGFGEISDIWYGEQYPSVPISEGAFSVHGRTKESLLGKSFDFDGLTNALSSAQLIIAHNAEFDARMITKIYPEAQKLPWFCSYRQWPFEKMPNKRLDTLCDHFQIDKPFKHDAISDAKCLHTVLVRHSGKTTRSKTYLHRLIQNDAWIPPTKESPSGQEPAKPAVKIHSFDREEMKQLLTGSKIPLEASPNSDRLVAYRKKIFSAPVPILSILKSDNPHIAEKVKAGFTIFLSVTINDGRTMELSFQAEEPVV